MTLIPKKNLLDQTAQEFGLQPLNIRTPDGLFTGYGATGPRTWVLTSENRRVAVFLDDGPNLPAFSYVQLSNESVIWGIWSGKVEVKLGRQSHTANRDRIGLLEQIGRNLFIWCQEIDNWHTEKIKIPVPARFLKKNEHGYHSYWSLRRSKAHYGAADLYSQRSYQYRGPLLTRLQECEMATNYGAGGE